MNHVKFLLVVTLAILVFNGTGCNDNGCPADLQNQLTGDVDVTEDSSKISAGIDSSEHRSEIPTEDDFGYYRLVNPGMSNNGAIVILGEDREFCVFDEPSGTCYKLTLANTRWKLIEVSIRKNYESTETVDYSGKNIIYDFIENDKIVISGKIDDTLVFGDFKEGEHSYEYGMMIACPVCLPGPNLTVDGSPSGIGGERYYAAFDDKKMSIYGYKNIGGVVGEDGGRIGGDHYSLGSTFNRIGDPAGGTNDTGNTSVRDNPRILKKSMSTRRRL
jgi:hypothetical protein